MGLCSPKTTASRQQLTVLKAGALPQHDTVVIYSRPGQPILVKRNQDDCLVVFPIWLPDGTSRAYTNAFIQVHAAYSPFMVPCLKASHLLLCCLSKLALDVAGII